MTAFRAMGCGSYHCYSCTATFLCTDRHECTFHCYSCTLHQTATQTSPPPRCCHTCCCAHFMCAPSAGFSDLSSPSTHREQCTDNSPHPSQPHCHIHIRREPLANAKIHFGVGLLLVWVTWPQFQWEALHPLLIIICGHGGLHHLLILCGHRGLWQPCFFPNELTLIMLHAKH